MDSVARNLFLQAVAGHQSDAAFRVGQMYEKGDGLPQDDHKAAECYENKLYNYYYPEKYPKGYVEYARSSSEAIESLFRLWSQGRGFPNDIICRGRFSFSLDCRRERTHRKLSFPNHAVICPMLACARIDARV